MSAEKNIYTHLHLRGNELRGFVFERLESDPDPIDGRIYYNVAKNEFRACISGVWVNIFSIWHVDDDGNITTDKQVIIKNNLIVEGDTSSGGEGEYTPSAGLDETRLQEYLDEHKYVTEGDIAELIPSNIATVDYVNTKFNSIDLSPYATTTELNALANRVVPIETWMDNVGQHITYDAELDAIVINHNLIVTKDTSSGGEGENTGASGIRGIYVNGEPYTDTDGDGFIDLGSISGGVSEITASMIDSALGYTPANNASLANYLPLSGGFMDNNASIKWYANAHSWDNAPDGLIGVSMVSDSLGYYGGLSFKGFYGIQIRAYGGDTDDISVRGYDASNWGTWRTLIHSGNYSDYAYPKNGKGYMSFDAQGRPVMSNNQGYSAYNTNGQIEEVMWLDSSNLLQLGGTTSQKVNIYGELTINYQDAIPSGNIGSQCVDVANSLTNRLIPSDLTTIGPKTINWFDWAQSTGQGISSYSYGIWTGSPDVNYGFGLGVEGFSDELYFKLMRGGTVGSWRRVITTSNDGYVYGLGGMIDIQYTDEINRYGGTLHLQYRGSNSSGNGTGGTHTGDITLCANGGNVRICTVSSSAFNYTVEVNGGIMCNRPIFGYMYGTNNNAAAFIFDKPGANYTGIGSNNTSDTIRFGACDINGSWVDGYAQNWMFYGDVKADKYRLNENNNSFIGTQIGYLSLNSAGNEICIGANGFNDIHINYRPSADGTAPKTYYWRAGSPTSWAEFYMGNTNIQGDLIVSGDTSSGSDIRFKDIIKNKTIKIEHIAKAPLFTFKWNDRKDYAIHLGSSAQYWEKVTPWLVKGEDFKTLDYSTLGVAMGISLAKKAVNHEERIMVLEKEIKRLKEEMIHG